MPECCGEVIVLYHGLKIVLLGALLLSGCRADPVERYPYHRYDDDDDYYDDYFDDYDDDIDIDLSFDKDIDIDAEAELDFDVDVDLDAGLDFDIAASIGDVFDAVADFTRGTVVISNDPHRSDPYPTYTPVPRPTRTLRPTTRATARSTPRPTYTPVPRPTARPTRSPRPTARPTARPTRSPRPTVRPTTQPPSTSKSLTVEVGELFSPPPEGMVAGAALTVVDKDGDKVPGVLLRLGHSSSAKLFLTQELEKHQLVIRRGTVERRVSLTGTESDVIWELEHSGEQVVLAVTGGLLLGKELAGNVAVKLHLVTVNGIQLINATNTANLLIQDGKGTVTFTLKDNDSNLDFNDGCYRWVVESLAPERAMFGEEFGSYCP